MFHIIKFDRNEYHPDEISNLTEGLQNILPKNDKVLILPYGIDFLIDIPKEELIFIRDTINKYLMESEES